MKEDRAADGEYIAAAEKRGLNNLIVPAPTTPEMIRKGRDKTMIFYYVLVSTVRNTPPQSNMWNMMDWKRHRREV